MTFPHCAMQVWSILAAQAELLAVLESEGQELLVAQGGRGGRGNATAPSQHNRPASRARSDGQPGQEVRCKVVCLAWTLLSQARWFVLVLSSTCVVFDAVHQQDMPPERDLCAGCLTANRNNCAV